MTTRIKHNPTLAEALEQDVKHAMEVRSRHHLSIFGPRIFTYVISDPESHLPDDLLGEGQRFHPSALQASVNEELQQNVREILTCLKDTGKNVGDLKCIMLRGVSYLVYSFNPVNAKPALA